VSRMRAASAPLRVTIAATRATCPGGRGAPGSSGVIRP
jgi:hypothetical protein